MNKKISVFKILFLNIVVLIPVTVFPQSSSSVQMLANKAYSQGDFYTAAKLYEQLEDSLHRLEDDTKPYMPAALYSRVSAKEKTTTIIYKIALSYYQLHDYTKAQAWFEKLKTKDSRAYLYYAICLRVAGKYEEAKKELQLLLSVDSSDNVYTKQAKMELENLEFITQQAARIAGPLFIIHKIYDTKETSDYALSVNDKDIVITSTRLDSAALQANQNPYLNQLYTAVVNDKLLEITGKVNISAEKNMHQGSASFSADGSRIFFTRWFKNNNDTVAAIYESEKKNNEWQAPVKLNNNINVDGYRSVQPFVTADSKYLIFASDMPGGLGKYDLWYAPLDKDYQPGKAFNLGDKINTAGNEETPFYHSLSNTLVFASDARVGMGGFDLYQSKGNFMQWDTVSNLGAPINSNKDELYFCSSNSDSLIWSNAYISSDRASECCLQPFSIEYIKPVPPPPPVVVITDSAITKKDTVTNDTPITTENENYTTTIYFKFNSSVLTDSARKVLDSLAATLHSKASVVVDIAAYTDGLGTSNYNINLSKKRAEACNSYLMKKRVNENQLHIHAYGKCCPIAEEKLPSGKDNPAGRQMNRRAELKLNTTGK